MTQRIGRTDLPRIPDRAPEAHKGSCGRVLVIAGARGMTGAACLAASAAARAGAGLVRAVVPAELEDIFEAKLTSALTLGVAGTGQGAFAEAAAERILKTACDWDAAVIGPGVGRSADLERFVARVVRSFARPLVVDADALFNLSECIEALDERAAATVVTPHPGEMARLARKETSEIQSNRAEVAEEFAARYGVVTVLKGRRTVVTDGLKTYVNLSGNPGLASGGTGDVLCGIIATLLAQGFDAFDAAALGAFVHGLAGDIVAGRIGEAGLVAEDVVEAVPAAIDFVAG